MEQTELLAIEIEKDPAISKADDEFQEILRTLEAATENEEHRKLFDRLDCLYGAIRGDIEIFAYTVGLTEGMAIQQSVNSLTLLKREAAI